MPPGVAVMRPFSAAMTGRALRVQRFSATLHSRDCIVAVPGDNIAARKGIGAEGKCVIAA
jgi:hypothetical protein